MESVEEKIKYLKVNKRKIEDRKYLIKENDRKRLKSINSQFIILIPYYQVIPNITDSKKKLFVYTTNIITDIFDNLIFIENNLDKELSVEKQIKDYIMDTFNIKSLKSDNVKQILEVENKKIQIYLINLGKKKKLINNFLETNNSERLKNKNNLELNLDNKYFKKRTFMCFYNNHLEQKNIKFDSSINSFIYQKLNKLNIYDDIDIEFRNTIFFNHL